MDAQQALADLTEISSQIRAAALLDADGGVAASTLADERSARAFADAARELVTAAEGVRSLGGDALTQLEVATGEGSVFVVREAGRTIAATTSPEPTVGLVFYDLKSCLRSASDAGSADEQPAREQAVDEQPADEPPAEEQPAGEAKPARKRAAETAEAETVPGDDAT